MLCEVLMPVLHVFSGKNNITASVKEGAFLLDELRKIGISAESLCAGGGRCGKCRVIAKGDISPRDEFENSLNLPEGVRLACRARVLGEAFVIAGTDTRETVITREPIEPYTLLFDLGTTTLEASLVDSKGEFARIRAKNPQSLWGADVISRIFEIHRDNALLLHLQGLINDFLHYCMGLFELKPRQIRIAGNTVMQYIFAGLDPTPLGQYPFTAEEKFAPGALYGPRDIKEMITLAPAVSAYVGGDLVAGLCERLSLPHEKNLLYIDVGTNGEIALVTQSGIYAASAAAGPCFEGAELECGMRFGPGAVTGAKFSGGEISAVFEGEKPLGICGSGAVALLAALLDAGLMDETGKCDTFTVSDGVYLSQRDIRKLQNAKAAIRAGIDVLCQRAGIDEGEIGEICLAGAFGAGADGYAMQRIGLIPKCGLITFLPDAVLRGLMRGDELYLTAEKIEYTELSLCGEFSEGYIERMLFSEDVL